MAIIWITGGKGFIGRHLAWHLAEQGHKVSGLGHGAWTSWEATRWGFSAWESGEISASNLGRLRQLFGEPEIIFHLAGGSSVGAAIANPQEDFSRTVVSSAELLEWVRQHIPATRIVAVSSAAVYGAGHAGRIAEEAQLNPFSPYGAHKLMMEILYRSFATNFGLQVALPRLFSVYGPEIKKQLLWDLCCKLQAGGRVELGGTGEELRDWTDVRDVARALIQMAELASCQAPVLNIGTGIPTSIREIAEMVIAHWNTGEVGAAAHPLTFSGQSRAGDPFSLVADSSRMHSQGIRCTTPVSCGVAEYVRWFQAQSMNTR